MRTLFVTDPPPVVEDWLAQRRALGQDLFDEVWEGEYHVAAAPSDRHADLQVQLIVILRPLAQRTGLLTRGPSNIGGPTDFRVPDLAFLGGVPEPVWQPGAAIVVEILSPGDESRRKLDFYFRAGVEEVLIVDPDVRAVEWFERGPDAFRPALGSGLLGITSTELTAAIEWPN
jgi:Uma2 family endonuclease